MPEKGQKETKATKGQQKNGALFLYRCAKCGSKLIKNQVCCGQVAQ
jgi:hypothetical protein